MIEDPASIKYGPSAGRLGTCPSCKSFHLRRVGKLPSADTFGDIRLRRVISGGSLIECLTCHLYFRMPLIPQRERDELYALTSDKVWDRATPERPDWAIARRLIRARFPRGAVCDLGCYNGRFLESLGDQVRRYGFEMSKAGRDAAKSKGIEILGFDLNDLSHTQQEFDVITAFDVIEHVEDPLKFLFMCTRPLRRGGMILLGTGNTDAFSWRIARSNYWYCAHPEHVAFINPRWCRWASGMLGFSFRTEGVLRRTAAGRIKRWGVSAKNLVYLTFPAFLAWLRRRGLVGAREGPVHHAVGDWPPDWSTARDHMVVTFTKP